MPAKPTIIFQTCHTRKILGKSAQETSKTNHRFLLRLCIGQPDSDLSNIRAIFYIPLFFLLKQSGFEGGGEIKSHMFSKKYNDIVTIESILDAWGRFLRGKRRRKDVAEFQNRLAENLSSLYYDLQNKAYRHGSYFAFNIFDPKLRNIHKACVRDRLLHHIIYKELYPYFEQRFIYDSYSCRENKGTHKALERFKYFAGKVSKNHTRTCYVLKCDIKKFFANIDHSILRKILERNIEDKDILWLLEQVIDSFYVPNSIYAMAEMKKGLPLGNLTSQLLVNVYMHEFDIFVKQGLRVKYYIRYADDFIILSEDKKYLEDLLVKFHNFLNNKLYLTLHENKVYIKTYGSGVDFLGWVHFPHHRQLRTATKKKIIKNMKGYPKPETVNSYRGLLRHGNTYKIQKRIFPNTPLSHPEKRKSARN